MRPHEWTDSYQKIDETGIPKIQIQFEALIIPYLPMPSKPGTQSERQATVINKLREDVFVTVKQTVEQIGMRAAGYSYQQVAVIVQMAINKVRTLFRDSFMYFPLDLECELDDQTDFWFNHHVTWVIAKLNETSGDLSLPHHLIPGADSVKSAIAIVEREKEKLVAEAGEWAKTDHRKYRHFLNRILKILIKQVLLIYVRHR